MPNVPTKIDPPGIAITPKQIAQNGFVRLEATNIDPKDLEKYWYDWRVTHPVKKKDVGRLNVDDDEPWVAYWYSKSDVGPHTVTLKVFKKSQGRRTGDALGEASDAILVLP